VAGLAVFASAASGQATPNPSPPAQPASPATSDGDATDLSILYAGAPGGEREKHFVEFLEEWFPEVQTISLEELTSKAAEPFDVVVADWKPQYKDGRSLPDAGPKVRLDPSYSKPTICLASVGSAICGGKLDWL
jgi:hypothetical protein